MNRRKFLRNTSIGVGSLLVSPAALNANNFKNVTPPNYEFEKRRILSENGFPSYRWKHTSLYSHEFKMTFPSFDFDFIPFVDVYRHGIGHKTGVLYYSVKFDKKGLSLMIDESENINGVIVDVFLMVHEIPTIITFEPTNKAMTKEHFDKLFE